eukprot:12425091-Karenia_brevis.AAC.1
MAVLSALPLDFDLQPQLDFEGLVRCPFDASKLSLSKETDLAPVLSNTPHDIATVFFPSSFSPCDQEGFGASSLGAALG